MRLTARSTIDISYYPTWITSCNTICRNIFCNNATCGNNTTSTDMNTFQYLTPCTNPHIITYFYWGRTNSLVIGLFTNFFHVGPTPLLIIYRMRIIIHNQTVATYIHIVTNGNALLCPKIGR
ncbi:hypothetical protein SAMN04487851_102276 [Prevotella sp. tc2-28]|nr:hypothetical protein SAMN04487851_102276 [Prevotella sp. tc2-28]